MSTRRSRSIRRSVACRSPNGSPTNSSDEPTILYSRVNSLELLVFLAPPWNLWVHGSSKGTTTCESAGGCPAVQPRYAAGRSVGRIRWLGRLLQHLGR